MYHIIKNSRPINDETFSSIEEARASLEQLGNPQAAPVVVPRACATYIVMGLRFDIVAGTNPAQARREHRAEVTQSATMATAKQMAYLNSLADRVPASAAAHWVKKSMTKQEASRAINALQDLAQA